MTRVSYNRVTVYARTQDANLLSETAFYCRTISLHYLHIRLTTQDLYG